MKIVYESNAGHTKQYAELLSEELKIECINLKKYKKTNEPIIYLGWVFADNIKGFKKIRNNNIICVIAVGMNYESKENTDKLISINNVDKPFFYLQGGVDYTKLKGIKKMMFKMVSDSVIKENKKEDQEMIKILKSGSSCVKKENLINIIKYIKSNEDQNE